MLYGHGDDAYRYKQNIKANFSSNVNFAGPSKALIQHLSQYLSHIGQYPEVMAESLATQITTIEGITSSVTNGATEAFYLIAQAWKNSKTLIAIPSFAEYESACTAHNHNITYLKHNKLTEKIISEFQMVWLCNPNNPDGNIISIEQLENWIKHCPSTFFVIDEAYIDFVIKLESAKKLIPLYPNLAVIRSLTKHFAIPGLRLGYILSQHTNLDKIEKIRMPWSVNSLAIEAGKYLLDNPNATEFNITEYQELANNLKQALGSFKNLKVHASSTPYFLLENLKGTAKELQQWLLAQGILVRNADNFREIGSNCVRISTQNTATNSLLINALAEWNLQHSL